VDHVISTGSTLLDLAISGGRIPGGGIPGGLFVEIFGPSQAGKTAILVEASLSAQLKGGKVTYLDPEGRLDREYSESYGLDIKDEDYHRPDTVTEMFDVLHSDKNLDPSKVNLVCADSIAALSTELEMGPEGDKMGMKRAKDFSGGFRKAARLLAEQNRILLCSNQIRDDEYGNPKSPGGHAISFYSSVRIQMTLPGGRVNSQIIRRKEPTMKVGDQNLKLAPMEKVVGIKATATVIKSIDDPFRKAVLYIYFGHGIDDVRGNLDYLKTTLKLDYYPAVDKEFKFLDSAVAHVEAQGLEKELRDRTIVTWEAVESAFRTERKRRVRW
jgi:RecA/RadA recombinase